MYGNDSAFDLEEGTIRGVDVSDCSTYQEVIHKIALDHGGETTAFTAMPYTGLDTSKVKRILQRELDEGEVEGFLEQL